MILESNWMHDEIKLYMYRLDEKYIYFIRQEYDNYFYIGISGSPIVEENIHSFMARRIPNAKYIEVTLPMFQNVFDNLEQFMIPVESILQKLIKYLRDTRIKNEYVSDEENKLFSWLGFNEFYPSRHIVIDKNGYLPIY